MSTRTVLIIAVVTNFFATFGPEMLTASGITVLLPDVPSNDVPEIVRPTIMISCHLSILVGWIGMPLGWSFARYSYLLGWGIAFVGTLVAGSAAFTAVGVALTMCLGLTGGFLVCYVFLVRDVISSPIKA